MKLDFTTGDTIHPEAIRYAHPLLFEDRAITVYAYPVEQILAE
ncbi:MAG: nucleotidyl transferase AbiEii/AbiGii toxin family protein, partial [Enterococcus aquimarinus]